MMKSLAFLNPLISKERRELSPTLFQHEEPDILEQAYDMDCPMRLRIRRSMIPKLRVRLEKVETLRFINEE